MNRKQKIGVQLAMLLADITLMGSVLAIYALRQTDEIHLYLLPWFAVLAAAFFLNFLFVQKKAPVNLVLLIDGVLTVGFVIFGQNILVMSQESFGVRILLGGLLAGSFVHGASMPMGEPRQNQLVSYLDGLVACLAILMVLNKTGSLNGIEGLLAFGGASAAGLLLALISSRIRTPGMERLEGKKGKGVAALGLILAGAAALAFWMGSHLKTVSSGIVFLVKSAADGIWAVLVWLGHGLNSFLLWLASFFPAANGGMILPEPEAGAAMETVEETAGGGGTLILILAVALLAAAFFWLLRQLKGKRLNGFSQDAAGSIALRTKSKKKPWGWIGRKWSEFCFLLKYWRNRNTPAGILTFAERWGKQAGMPRGTGESGPSYLRRLAVTREKGDSKCLWEAASELEKEFYGRGGKLSPSVVSDCRNLLKQFRKDACKPSSSQGVSV